MPQEPVRGESMTEENEEAKSPWWITTINRLGLPTALLCVILFMLWRGGVWVADHVAIPIVSKQIEFINSASKTNEEMAKMTAEIRDTMKQQQLHGDNATRELQKLSVSVDENQIQAEGRRKLLEVSAEYDQKNLETLKSIDQTLKSQQLVLHSLNKHEQ